jgi:DNA-binding MarR family transcriptional regulator
MSAVKKTVKTQPVKTAPATDALDSSLGYSLRRAQLSTYADFSASIDKFEVRPSQLTVLVLIRYNPGLTQSAISETLGIQKANFVSLLDRLEERGLTERRKVGGDRRASALYLTPAGELFVKKLEGAHAAFVKKLTARLGIKRSGELLSLLHAFRRAEHTTG